MRLLRSRWLLGFSALGAVLAGHAVGCGSNGSATSHSGTTTGSGGSGTGGHTGTAGSTSSSGTAGGGGTGGSMPACGNGKVEGTEQCDLGTDNGGGKGCNSSCAFDCTGDADCNKGSNACAGMATCVSGTQQGQMVKACQPGTPLANGASCGTNLICLNNNCVAPACGDGFTSAPEECDDGNATAGDGCETNCKFTCLATDPTRNCASTNPCVGNGTCGNTHTCAAGTPVTDGTTCPTGTCQAGVCTAASCTGQAKCTVCAAGLCNGTGTCVASTCGDGCVDASKGEECDPPNGTTCSATCKNAVAAACGNGVVDPGEQCDDGNKFDLDGCDSNCKYEVVARMNAIAISGTAAPAALGCMTSTNQLGAKALTALALGQLNSALATSISGSAGTAPSVNVMTQFLGLTDLTGTAASGFQIGVLDGSVDPAKGAWPGNNPLDWWFLADGSTVSMGLPTGRFTTTSLAAHNLKAGPNDVTLLLNLGGSVAPLTMLAAHIAASINANPVPSKPAPPPANLAAGLTVFETITGNGTGQGLCGNITVASLAKIPVPSALTSGIGNCSQAYISCVAPHTTLGVDCNSLLDVLVSGCSVIIGTVINKTQPDVPAGATIKTLTPGASHIIPSSQTNGDTDAYSAYLTFTAKRAHFTGETCTQTSDCQTGKTCTTGVCK